MAQSIYITSTEGLSGKSTIVLGVIDALTRSIPRVGVFRSIARSTAERDYVLEMLLDHIGVDLGSLSGAAYAVGGIAWLGLGSLYLFIFWSLSGQTPGMRFLDIRIEHDGQRAIGPRRAFKRLVGFWLSAIPLPKIC